MREDPERQRARKRAPHLGVPGQSNWGELNLPEQQTPLIWGRNPATAPCCQPGSQP